MAPPVKVYDAKLSTRTKLHILQTIKDQLSLNPVRYEKFRNTVFGPWLDIQTLKHDNHLINYLLQHQRYVNDAANDETPFIFDIGNHTLEFGRREFCLVTGFQFGNSSLKAFSKGASSFHARVFPKVKRVKGKFLYEKLNDNSEFKNLDDDDAVRLCLLLALNNVFMGREIRHVISKEILKLVDNFFEWDKFPWGDYMWKEFHCKVYNHDHTNRKGHLKKISEFGPKYLPNYTLQGFVFPLKIWLLETFPHSSTWWEKEIDVIPRCVAWSDVVSFTKGDYDRLFGLPIRVRALAPTSEEMNTRWWKSSLEYFHNSSIKSTSPAALSKSKKLPVKRKAVSQLVHTEDEVQKEAIVDLQTEMNNHEDLQVNDEEIPSESEVLKMMEALQREWHTKFSSLEKYVNQHKAMQASSSSTPAVVNDHMDLDTDSFSENPIDGKGLFKQFEAMRENFVKRMKHIEQYLKTTQPAKVQKTSIVDQDSFTHRSCLSDNHVTVAESKSLFVDPDLKNPVISSVEPTNVEHHDPKTPVISSVEPSNVELQGPKALEEENIAGTSFLPEDDPLFSSNRFDFQQEEENVDNYILHDDQQASLKNLASLRHLDDSLELEDIYATEFLCSLNKKDAPKQEMHNPLPSEYQGSNNVEIFQSLNTDVHLDSLSIDNAISHESPDVKLKRDSKVSYLLQDPYTVLPDSTQPKPKVRPKTKALKKLSLPLTTPDGEVIPEWTEDLCRAANAPKQRVNAPKEILDFVFKAEDISFCFPWAKDGTFVCKKFWQGLLGFGKERHGWLSDTHLDLWVAYLWHFRHEGSDWALAGPHFHSKLFMYDPQACYADGITYGLPWFANSVEKVYFPMNIEYMHWILAEFHIRSGVITIYDSLPPYEFLVDPDAYVEKRYWWLKMMDCYQKGMPNLLEKVGVLKQKGIDETNYTITYYYARNVPIQGELAYGDCGIWVMRNMYRLVNNLSLEVNDPTVFGLAYREWLTDFFWKYKIPLKNSCLDLVVVSFW